MRSSVQKLESKDIFSFPLFLSSHAVSIICLLLRDLRIQPLKPPRQTSGLVTENEKVEIFSNALLHSHCVSVSFSLSKHCGAERLRRIRPWRRVEETDGGGLGETDWDKTCGERERLTQVAEREDSHLNKSWRSWRHHIKSTLKS